MALLGLLWRLFWAWPIGWLTIYGCLHMLGMAVKSSKKPLLALVGLGFLLWCLGKLWKARADVGRGAMVLIGGGVVLAWGLTWWFVPEYRLKLTAPIGAVACLAIGFPNWGWLDTHVGDRSVMEVVNDLVEGRYNRNAVAAVAPDARVSKGTKVADGWEYHTLTNGDPTTLLDPHAIGGQVNRHRGTTEARNVTITPGEKLGTATVRVSPVGAPPELTPWEKLAKLGPIKWEGPSTTRADDPIVFGYDVHAAPQAVAGPAPNTMRHTLVAGGQRTGKSATLAVIAAEASFRPQVAMIMLDPLRVEFSPWKARATAVVGGVTACRRALIELLAYMDGRAARVEAAGRRTAPLGPGWPRVLIFLDEVAAVADVRGEPDPEAKRFAARSLAALTKLSEQSGKFGMKLILATQRSEVGVLEGRLRDNLQSRVGHRHQSGDGSRMVTGKEGPDLTGIPLSLQGAYWLDADDQWSVGRSLLISPRGFVPADEEAESIAYAAAEIAGATAHLRIPWEAL